MMTFQSSADLSRLQQTDPARTVITKLANGLFSDNQPVTIALMEPRDIDHPLTQLSTANDIHLEGILEQQGMYLIALETDYGYGIVYNGGCHHISRQWPTACFIGTCQ